MLDIGSGAGVFTSRLVKKLGAGGALFKRPLELTMMDQLDVNPARYFGSAVIGRHLTRVEYVASDFAEGVQRFAHEKPGGFDIVLFLRILHNISRFTVEAAEEVALADGNGRYPVDTATSCYFEALGKICPELTPRRRGRRATAGSPIWVPRRLFNQDALILPDGGSLVDAVTRIGRAVVVEDGDLNRESLLAHLREFKLDDIHVYDPSARMRLSINHVYVLTRTSLDAADLGERIWPS